MFECGDYLALASAIKWAIGASSQREAALKANRRRVESKYDQNANMGRLEAAYQRLCEL